MAVPYSDGAMPMLTPSPGCGMELSSPDAQVAAFAPAPVGRTPARGTPGGAAMPVLTPPIAGPAGSPRGFCTPLNAQYTAPKQDLFPVVSHGDDEAPPPTQTGLPLSAPFPPPGKLSPEWARSLAERLEAATFSPLGPEALPLALPPADFGSLVDDAARLLLKEPTLVEARCAPGARATIVGDTHGQLHDLTRLLRLSGDPGDDNLLVVNGDFVDRGAWGVEALALLCAWKVARPGAVFLLRGNHESSLCTQVYGFKRELQAKYGPAAGGLYRKCLRLFAALPLAARVGGRSENAKGRTLVLHGGLFRRPPPPRAGAGRGAAAKRRRPVPVASCLEVGTLDDLKSASKGGQDPDGEGASLVATDVLWSDPALAPGLSLNDSRGVGVVFGPDVTAAFLESQGLRLLLRSHEGPDARAKRDDGMPGMGRGFSVDHAGEAGHALTVFSAPDYPQFQTEEPGQPRPNNLAAFAVLTGPGWCDPVLHTFGASRPRPVAAPYYELDAPDSDEERAEQIAGGSDVGSEMSELSVRSGGGGE